MNPGGNCEKQQQVKTSPTMGRRPRIALRAEAPNAHINPHNTLWHNVYPPEYLATTKSTSKHTHTHTHLTQHKSTTDNKHNKNNHRGIAARMPMPICRVWSGRSLHNSFPLTGSSTHVPSGNGGVENCISVSATVHLETSPCVCCVGSCVVVLCLVVCKDFAT